MPEAEGGEEKEKKEETECSEYLCEDKQRRWMFRTWK